MKFLMCLRCSFTRHFKSYSLTIAPVTCPSVDFLVFLCLIFWGCAWNFWVCILCVLKILGAQSGFFLSSHIRFLKNIFLTNLWYFWVLANHVCSSWYYVWLPTKQWLGLCSCLFLLKIKLDLNLYYFWFLFPLFFFI